MTNTWGASATFSLDIGSIIHLTVFSYSYRIKSQLQTAHILKMHKDQVFLNDLHCMALSSVYDFTTVLTYN